MRFADLAGARIALLGAGREAAAALAAITRRLPGQRPTVVCAAHEIEALISGARGYGATLAASDIDAITGPVDAATLAGFDLVIRSPGISIYREPLASARARGVRVMTGSALWFAEREARTRSMTAARDRFAGREARDPSMTTEDTRRPAAPVIGITGTKGKSTTSALLAHLLRAAGKRVALAGNIGVPLLALLDPPVEPDCWVIELSSYQIADLGDVPDIACVLNLYPEHLDWHGDVDTYYRDKLRLLGTETLAPPGIAVLDHRQRYPLDRAPLAGRIREFNDADGFHEQDGALYRGAERLLDRGALALPGAHNVVNLAAALTLVAAVGVDPLTVLDAAARFRALPHRLASLGRVDGVEWVDDSIATTPHATLAALDHFKDRAVVALVGGYDRGVDWSSFRQSIAERFMLEIICFGAAGPRIADALLDDGAFSPRVTRCAHLEDAVTLARAAARADGVILLSPGAPSFDAFADYAARGRAFAALGGFAVSADAIEGVGL